jgi:hypothetical protein
MRSLMPAIDILATDQETSSAKCLNDLLRDSGAFERFFGEPIWIPRADPHNADKTSAKRTPRNK